MCAWKCNLHPAKQKQSAAGTSPRDGRALPPLAGASTHDAHLSDRKTEEAALGPVSRRGNNIADGAPPAAAWNDACENTSFREQIQTVQRLEDSYQPRAGSTRVPTHDGAAALRLTLKPFLNVPRPRPPASTCGDIPTRIAVGKTVGICVRGTIFAIRCTKLLMRKATSGISDTRTSIPGRLAKHLRPPAV